MKVEHLESILRPIVEKWKDSEGNLIMILHEIQNELGYVPREAALHLSKLMSMPLARIYEVITFYNFFKLEPPGKYVISVCLGTACYLKGAPKIVDEFNSVLGLTKKTTITEDRLFQIEEVRCLGCCGLAPVVTVNGEVFGRVKAADATDIIEKFRQRELNSPVA